MPEGADTGAPAGQARSGAGVRAGSKQRLRSSTRRTAASISATLAALAICSLQ